MSSLGNIGKMQLTTATASLHSLHGRGKMRLQAFIFAARAVKEIAITNCSFVDVTVEWPLRRY